jgi:hypothetical protein
MGKSPVITADVYSIMPDFPVITANLYSITAGAYSKTPMSAVILSNVPVIKRTFTVITAGVPIIQVMSGDITAVRYDDFLFHYIFRKYFVFL